MYIGVQKLYLCKIAIATEARRFTRVPFPSSGFACTNFFVLIRLYRQAVQTGSAGLLFLLSFGYIIVIYL